METQDSDRPSLPRFRKMVVWHPQSSLIVSPFTRSLPARVTSDMNSRSKEDLLSPRMLEDKDVYLAFYLRKNWDNGALFSTLAIPNIAALIVEAPGQTAAQPRYVLRDDVCKAWAELENFLLDISEHLYSHHCDRHLFPDIDFPRWPHQCGYRVPHDSVKGTFNCL